ncbi:MAG: hypothetical protein LBB40_02770 [Holophagales bacterium]|jgi:hypothetical protein|nr:hypothetical protein [Holophagales bacterium]
MESIAVKSLSLPRSASANGDLPPFLTAAHFTSAALKRSASHLDKQDDFKVDWL